MATKSVTVRLTVEYIAPVSSELALYRCILTTQGGRVLSERFTLGPITHERYMN